MKSSWAEKTLWNTRYEDHKTQRWNVSEKTRSTTFHPAPLFHLHTSRLTTPIAQEMTGSAGHNVTWQVCSSHACGHLLRFGHQADSTSPGILQNAGSAALGFSSADSWQGSWNFLSSSAKADTWVLFLSWTSWVLSFFKSPSVYPADAQQDAEIDTW